MLDLPDLTLVAVYTVAHELTEMAVAECMRHVRFGDVKLFTNRPLRSQADAIEIEPFRDHRSLDTRSFGFHGMFNWPFVLTPAQLEQRTARATGYCLGSQHCREMMQVLEARRSGMQVEFVPA